jgi:hypothetical protein
MLHVVDSSIDPLSQMNTRFIVLLLFSALVEQAVCKQAPGYIKDLYKKVKESECTGDDVLKSGFHDTDGDNGGFMYCQKDTKGKAIYLKGKKGELVNMDVDCDGGIGSKDDKRCSSSKDTQAITAFQDQVSRHGLNDLNPTIIPYVVFGNTGNDKLEFDPTKHGIKPLSVMAVVCNNKLVYGVWGDTNGEEDEPKVGEASISLATECFGKAINGDNGHDQKDVLFLAFPGEDAVPGGKANWKAKSFKEFEKSIESIGDKLIERFKPE